MTEQLDRLKQQLADIHDLNRANALLGWDMQTYMPPGGAAARGRQRATLSRMAHELFTAPEVGVMLDAAATEVADLSPENADAALVRVAREEYEDLTKIPPSLVSEITQ